MDLHGRSLLKVTDLNAEEFLFLVDLARQLRADKRRGRDRAAAGGPQHRPDLREDLHPDPVRVRGRRPRRGRARHLPRPGGIPAGPQGVGEGHRPRARPHVRRHRVPRIHPGIHGDPRRVRRGAGLERAHRHLAPDPDAGRHPDHDRPLQQATGRGVLLLPGRRPEQHGELAAGDRGHARHGRPHLRPGGAAAVGGGARHRRGPGRRIRRQAPGDRGRQRGRGRGGLRLHRRVAVPGRAGGPVGHPDRPASPLPGELRRAEGHRQPGGQVPALPARPAQPRHRDRPADLRQARAGRAGGHRRGLRVTRLGGVRPGGEPDAHDQGPHDRHARRARAGDRCAS